jgi:hypothetical protein
MSGSKRQNRRALIGYRARDFGRFSQGRSRSARQCPRGWLRVPRTGRGPARVPISSDATIACRTAARPCRRLLRSTATAHRSQGCGRRKHRPRARLASSSLRWRARPGAVCDRKAEAQARRTAGSAGISDAGSEQRVCASAPRAFPPLRRFALFRPDPFVLQDAPWAKQARTLLQARLWHRPRASLTLGAAGGPNDC